MALVPLILSALRDGVDVYWFLLGMIALAELAGTQGAFAWIAERLTGAGASTPARAFWLVYAAGIIVTALLSNDATILLLTPAAIAVARRIGAPALPLAFACAMVANAASFVLPISNPANLLLYPRLPSSGTWLASFGLASLVSVAVTGAVLFARFRKDLALRGVTRDVPPARSSRALSVTLVMVAASCVALVAAASLQLNVGICAAACAAASCALVRCFDRSALANVVRGGQWSIIPLVAVLFVIVRLADHFGAIRVAREVFAHAALLPHPFSQLATGFAIAIFANVANNLPAAVLAHYAAPANPAVLVGVDLGPNAALSGSLATILWANILRRAGERIDALTFLRTGLLVAVPALVLTLAAVR